MVPPSLSAGLLLGNMAECEFRQALAAAQSGMAGGLDRWLAAAVGHAEEAVEMGAGELPDALPRLQVLHRLPGH